MTLDADPARLAQVISNLLNNAAKYTEEGGQIWLTARRHGNEAVISVRDNGLGIPPETLPVVFDMFAQVDRTIKRAQGGLGIGLTLSRNLVELHGGTIECHSEGPGKGSEFTVRLPLSWSGVSRIAPLKPFRRRSGPLPARRILVVDDTRAAVYMLGKLLETMGQKVTTASDGPAALEIIRNEQPEIVISDIGMPLMDGYELARRIRLEAGGEGPVLVALTGYGQDSDRQRAKAAGFDHHLTKPVSLDDLHELFSSLAPIQPVLTPSRIPAAPAIIARVDPATG